MYIPEAGGRSRWGAREGREPIGEGGAGVFGVTLEAVTSAPGGGGDCVSWVGMDR